MKIFNLEQFYKINKMLCGKGCKTQYVYFCLNQKCEYPSIHCNSQNCQSFIVHKQCNKKDIKYIIQRLLSIDQQKITFLQQTQNLVAKYIRQIIQNIQKMGDILLSQKTLNHYKQLRGIFEGQNLYILKGTVIKQINEICQVRLQQQKQRTKLLQKINKDINDQFQSIKKSLQQKLNHFLHLQSKKQNKPPIQIIHTNLNNPHNTKFETNTSSINTSIKYIGPYGSYYSWVGAVPFAKSTVSKFSCTMVASQHSNIMIGILSKAAIGFKNQATDTFQHAQSITYRFGNGKIWMNGSGKISVNSVNVGEKLQVKVDLVNWIISWSVSGGVLFQTSIIQSMREKQLFIHLSMINTNDVVYLQL